MMKWKRHTISEKVAIARKAMLPFTSMAAVAHAEGLPDSTVWGWVKEIAELEAKLAQEQNGNFKTCAFQTRRMH